MISPPSSDKIVMWRFLRNRRLILRLNTIFRALIYRAHRAVVPAIAWHVVSTACSIIGYGLSVCESVMLCIVAKRYTLHYIKSV